MIVLGVDPGSVRTGWGVLDWQGSRARLSDKGVIAAPARFSLPERLRLIHEGVAALIARVNPDLMAVEEAFHAANVRTALVLGHVRGVVLLAGAAAGVPIREFPPATIKQQVTGNGRADKAQVALMVERHLGLPGAGEAGDAADALAVALCCAHQHTPLAAVLAGRRP